MISRIRIRALIAAVAISIAAIGGVAFADAPTREAALVGRGVLAERPWEVMVGRHRRGVCLQTVYETGGSTVCSAPVERRGILQLGADGRLPGGPIRITVIAGAFDPAVRTLRFFLTDGSVMDLHPRPIHSKRADATIKAYRYVAKPVEGPLCVDQVETVAAGGRILWDISERDTSEFELQMMGLKCEPAA